MPLTVTIKKNDNLRRGEVIRSVEFTSECRVVDMIGAIDGLLRQCFPGDMRHRNLNLSRDTTIPEREADQLAQQSTPIGGSTGLYYEGHTDIDPFFDISMPSDFAGATRSLYSNVLNSLPQTNNSTQEGVPH